ncbi:hypothetical protein M8C21_031934 [Ambrosia artemisiifolia]|uniref:Exocyst complex component Sec6 n=1 Tax=Ambrosia artemisiifolia TaxID=4212 RepID=A0AAD5C2J0_AMBAR|nr:hypothetical protein M8C21_031934 [Ambrosia artemisiifolia]
MMMMVEDLGIEAKESAVREVAKLLPVRELLVSISSIKADYIARQQANDAQLSTMVAEQVEQAQAGLKALAASQKAVNHLRENFINTSRLCKECQTLIENHDQIKLLSNARNNLNTTLKDVEGMLSISVEAAAAKDSLRDDKELINTYEVMIDFQAAMKKGLAEPASEIGLEPLCAMINNNLRCYDLAMELASSIIEALSENYAEQVNFDDTCKGFLEVAKEAIHQTVIFIFDDPGAQELLVKLYHKEWSEGQITESLVETFDDYYKDVQMFIEERSYKRFVDTCLEETVIAYVDHLLAQKNYIKEETIERMILDEEILMDFFKKHTSVKNVENRLRILVDLRELASAESPDTFTLVYTHILEHQPDCPPEVVERLVGLREGIPRKDAKEVCILPNLEFENWVGLLLVLHAKTGNLITG